MQNENEKFIIIARIRKDNKTSYLYIYKNEIKKSNCIYTINICSIIKMSFLNSWIYSLFEWIYGTHTTYLYMYMYIIWNSYNEKRIIIYLYTNRVYVRGFLFFRFFMDKRIYFHISLYFMSVCILKDDLYFIYLYTFSYYIWYIHKIFDFRVYWTIDFILYICVSSSLYLFIWFVALKHIP